MYCLDGGQKWRFYQSHCPRVTIVMQNLRGTCRARGVGPDKFIYLVRESPKSFGIFEFLKNFIFENLLNVFWKTQIFKHFRITRTRGGNTSRWQKWKRDDFKMKRFWQFLETLFTIIGFLCWDLTIAKPRLVGRSKAFEISTT